jgi:hypothetical protein
MFTGVTVFGVALASWVPTVAGLILWVVVIGIVFRMILLRTHDRIRCPATRRMAYVTRLRGPDGRFDDVLRCSLVRKDAPFRCAKRCLHAAPA